MTHVSASQSFKEIHCFFSSRHTTVSTLLLIE